jgi:tRNA1(Val) A37 N6-methylase TrmN6
MLMVVELAKALITSVVRPGDIVVDATVGNGCDTAFLAELVGPSGMVYGFDIQQKSIDSASELLINRGVEDRVRLIHDGHQRLDHYITTPVKAVMFNLGYLPGGDHRIKTSASTTLAAVKKSIELLETGGMITIAAYPGHDGGRQELEQLLEFLASEKSPSVLCIKAEVINRNNNPPVLIAIEKRQ